jgi:hypothetical protein
LRYKEKTIGVIRWFHQRVSSKPRGANLVYCATPVFQQQANSESLSFTASSCDSRAQQVTRGNCTNREYQPQPGWQIKIFVVNESNNKTHDTAQDADHDDGVQENLDDE